MEMNSSLKWDSS